MKLCITSHVHSRTLDWKPRPFAESVRWAADAGFTQMDYSLNCRLLGPENWKQQVEEQVRTAADAGITFHFAHLPYDYPRTREEEAWKQFTQVNLRGIEVCRELGVAAAAIHPRTFMTPAYDRDEERRQVLAFMAPIVEKAHKEGVKLALENMRGAGQHPARPLVRYGTEVNDIIDLADTLEIGICWDTGHGNISGQKQYESIMKIGDRLLEVHLNDNYAEDDIHLAPYLGGISWNEVVQALHDVGYRDSLNFEVDANRLPAQAGPAYIRALHGCGEQIRDLFEQASGGVKLYPEEKKTPFPMMPVKE